MATDAQREFFCPAATHGNVRLYTAEFANTAGLGGIFHNVCCFALSPDFNLLYCRGRSWWTLLQGELLQRALLFKPCKGSPATQASCYSCHTLLTSTLMSKRFPSPSSQFQTSWYFPACAAHQAAAQHTPSSLQR